MPQVIIIHVCMDASDAVNPELLEPFHGLAAIVREGSERMVDCMTQSG
jgi:hypothetical protein